MRPLGATIEPGGVRFSVWSGAAERVWVSIFDRAGEHETDRVELARGDDGVFSAFVPGLSAGGRYGFRADGPYEPERGLWFDPDKLLTDPYAVEIDRPYRYDTALGARRGEGSDTAPLMPKGIVVELPEPLPETPPLFRPGALIYELSVRGFTMRHPEIPEEQRGTLRALAHPTVIGHLQKLGVAAVELMPVTAWIDERHLPPLGLANAWGYNPISFMALDPRLAPGGLAELRETVAALRQAGIGVILDMVFNHTGESDVFGTTLSLRGLDAATYFRHAPDGSLVNDAGTGNVLACDRPVVRRLILDTLRHFVRYAGVDGFRFDLAPVLGRTDGGFDPNAELLQEIAADPLLADRVLIAEPWDIGPGGYQVGRFRPPFLEWNDRFRDDVRRFWRGDAGMIGGLATRLAGSSDIFSGAATRTVNFVAAHDGMSLLDTVSYAGKHNEANGEQNRDGHHENFSWNSGVEGATDDDAVLAARRRDVMALLATLFLARGTPMLTAGDEFGRTQGGNNNAYAQDNEVTWLDWAGRDAAIEEAAARLSAFRASHPVLEQVSFLRGSIGGEADVEWLREDGQPFAEADWHDPERRALAMVLAELDGGRIAAILNAGGEVEWRLPGGEGDVWRLAFASAPTEEAGEGWLVPARSVLLFEER